MKENKLIYKDHKSTQNTLSIKILWIVLSVVLIFLFSINWLFNDNNETEIILIVGAFIFFGMGVLPTLLILVFQNKLEFVFDLSASKLEIWNNSKLTRSIPFGQINNIRYSEYKYTVNSKNGTRTVHVFTIVTEIDGSDQIVCESLNFIKLRRMAEEIAKALDKTTILPDGMELKPEELDLSILEKTSIPWEKYEKPTFPENSHVHIQTVPGQIQIQFKYVSKIYLYISFFISFAVTLLFHLMFGDLFELSIFDWEGTEPNLSFVSFLVINLVVGLSPTIYVLYKMFSKKIWIINQSEIQIQNNRFRIEDIEEIQYKSPNILFLNDRKMKKLSLVFYGPLGEYERYFHLLMHSIRSIYKKDWEDHNRFY